MKRLILGTAGHIDHGKTTLVKALTGTDTDRLKEEKERGITIDLGFASLDLPSGLHIGIVDVPGHERFVKNMVAGASGIDVVALIIAADEGVMPQTREHLDICTLLGIRHGFVVLTKIDLVDQEWIELVKEDVAEFITGTFLEGAPVIGVSAVTGEGLDELVAIIDSYFQKIPQRSSQGIFRLPVDRVFTIKGFGTVVTGTLVSGKIRTGETITVYPSMLSTKVRGLQVHDSPVEEAGAGLRTAVNMQGIEKNAVFRGDVLGRPGTLFPTYMIDARLHYLKENEKPLKNRTRVRLHIGTSQIPSNVILLDTEVLNPGESGLVQLRLDSPAVCIKEDRFVIRSISPVRTLGGGTVIDPLPEKHKRFKEKTNSFLAGLEKAQPARAIEILLKKNGLSPVTAPHLMIRANVSGREADRILQDLRSNGTILLTDRTKMAYIHRDTYEAFKARAIEALSVFHQENPLKSGIPKGELKSRLELEINDRLFNYLTDRMLNEGAIHQTDETIHLPGHKPALGDESKIADKITKVIDQGGLSPPTLKELSTITGESSDRLKEILMHLVKEGRIIKVKDGLFFSAAAIENLKERLVRHLEKNGEIDTPSFKDMTKTSRKYTIPLLEYFDAVNITLRVGDVRRLRKKG